MKKSSLITTNMVAITLLFLIIMPINIKMVNAVGGSATFCPNNFVDGLDTETEILVSNQTCSTIYAFLGNYGNNQYNYKQLYASRSTYTSVLNSLQVLCTYSSIFSKGHNTPWGNPNHYQLLDYIGAGVRDSQYVYPYTSAAENKFVFLWHCATAHSYPSWEDAYGWTGHAYCWTRQNNMNTNGYWSTTGDYVFIGCYNYSHQFSSIVTENDDYMYADFCYRVFQSLYQGNSVKDAIDDASQIIYGTNFWNTPLYQGETFGSPALPSKMKIFGNGSLDLPT